jgi:hypothetical protein
MGLATRHLDKRAAEEAVKKFGGAKLAGGDPGMTKQFCLFQNMSTDVGPKRVMPVQKQKLETSKPC